MEHFVGGARTTKESLALAVHLATSHQVSIWDAIVLATASIAGCRLLLSEDTQDGFTWGGVTVIDPFAAEPHPLLAAALRAEYPHSRLLHRHRFRIAAQQRDEVAGLFAGALRVA